jgi:hypothetical protein
MPVITCEAIDLHTKEPLVGIEVILRSITPFKSLFRGVTNVEGKVEQWDIDKSCDSGQIQLSSPLSDIWWQMGFCVQPHFRGATCYTAVDVNFTSFNSGERYVQVELSPTKYNTSISEVIPPSSRILRNRHIYNRLSRKQCEALSQQFEEDPYPTDETVMQIARKFNATPLRVRQWYSTKRYKTNSGEETRQSQAMVIWETLFFDIMSLTWFCQPSCLVMKSTMACDQSKHLLNELRKQLQAKRSNIPVERLKYRRQQLWLKQMTLAPEQGKGGDMCNPKSGLKRSARIQERKLRSFQGGEDAIKVN